jgi:hypothetical protein
MGRPTRPGGYAVSGLLPNATSKPNCCGDLCQVEIGTRGKWKGLPPVAMVPPMAEQQHRNPAALTNSRLAALR